MPSRNGDWKTYLLGLFATIMLALAGAGYASVNSRITSLETDKDALTREVITLSANVNNLTLKMNEINTTVKDTNSKLEDLRLMWAQNSKIYRDSMVKWNQELAKRH